MFASKIRGNASFAGRRGIISKSALLMMAVAPAALLFSTSAQGATDTWTGGSVTPTNKWTDAGNWGGTAPVSGVDNLVFNGNTQTTNQNDFVNGIFTGIAFAPTAGVFHLTGNSIDLGLMLAGGAGTATAGDIINNSSNAESIGLAGITLDPSVHLFSTGNFTGTGGQLNISSNITQSPGSAVVFRTVSSNINFTGSNLTNDSSANGGILGGWAMIGGTNTVAANFATLDANKNVVAYTGYFNITGNGTLPNDPTQNVSVISNTGGVGATTPALPASVTHINTLLFAGTTATTTAAAEIITIGAGNTLVLGQNGGIMNATATGGGTLRNLTIGSNATLGGTLTAGDGIHPANITFSSGAVPNVAGYLTINSNITDNGTAPVSVTVTGGYITENGTGNTYSGGTYIVAGRVSQALATAFGTGPVYIYPGGETNTTSKIANNFFISGNGSLEQPGQGLGAIRLFGAGATAATLSGTISLTADAMISATNTSTPSITGQITGTGNLTIGRTNGSQGGGVLFIGSTTVPGNINNYTGDTILAGPTGGSATTALEINTPFTPGSNDNIMPHGLTGSFSGGTTGNLILDATTLHSATFDVNGTTQTINGLSSTAAAPSNNFITSSGGTQGLLIIGDSNASGNFGGTIQDGGSPLAITKIGSGIQTFSGTNFYSGDTNINGGTLISTGILSSANVNVNTTSSSTTFAGTGFVINIVLAANNGSNKATLAPGTTAAAGSIGTLDSNALTVNGGNLLFDLGSAGVSDLIAVGGTVQFNGAASIIPNGGSAGTYTVLTSPSSIVYTVSPTLIVPAHDPLTRVTNYTLDTTTDPTKIFINVTGGAKSLTWTGTGSALWDINNATIKNFADTTPSPDVFFNNDSVTFGDGPANRNITISGTVLPGSVTVANSAPNDYTFISGIIGGTANLTKSNGGNLTLASNNTYSGGTTINGGFLFVGNNGTSGSLGSGPISDNADLVFARTDAISIPNAINGGGNVTIGKTGTNANVTLTAVNNYSGATIVAAGSTLVIASSGSIISSSGVSLNNSTEIINGFTSTSNFGSSLAVGSGGGLVKYGSSMNLNGFATTSITVNTTTGGTLTIDINDPSFSIKTYANGCVFTGGGDLVFTNSQGVANTAVGGLDTYTLTNGNTGDTGNITVSGGLRLEPTTTTSLTNGNITVINGSQLFFGGNNGTYANNFNIAGVGTQVDEPSLGALRLVNTAASTTTLTGNITVPANATITGGAAVNDFGILNGQITGPGALTLASGTFTLADTTANASNYGPTTPGSIATTIASISGRAATVTVNDVNSISHGGLQLQGGTLHLNGFSLAVTNLSSTVANNTIDNSGTGTITLTFGNDNTSQSFSGILSDGATGGFLGITKTGTGNETLSGINTYTGPTNINAGGALSITSAGALSNTTPVTANGTLNLNNSSQILASLNGSGNVNLNTTALTIAGGGSLAGSIVDGGTNGSLTVGSSFSVGSFQVGTVNANANLQIQGTSKTNVLNLVGSTGAWTTGLDLTNSKLIVESDAISKPTAITQLRDQVNSGRTTTNGIFSSTLPSNYGIAVVDNASVSNTLHPTGFATFGGLSVDSNSILIAPELLGDANLDGKVTLTDLAAVLNNFGQQPTWLNGGFGSSPVGLSDLADVLNNFGQSNPNPSDGSVVSAIATPEPTSLALLGLGAAALLSRRRKV